MVEKPSYVNGGAVRPLLYETIDEVLKRAAERWPQREALVSRQQQWRLTYSELETQTNHIATGLLALGLRPGDRIGLWSSNRLEWTLTQYASAKAGLVLVTINPAYRLLELEYALNKVGCRALIMEAKFKSSDYLSMLCQLAPEIERCDAGGLATKRVPTLRTLICFEPCNLPGVLLFRDLASIGKPEHRAQLEETRELSQPDAPVNIQFTSGTTGFPKAATLTHWNILNNARWTGEVMHISDRDVICVPVPLYHCFAMVLANLTCMMHGASAVYPSAGFDPLAVLEAVDAERCTALYGVPTMFIATIDHPDFSRFDLSCLRTGIMGGSPCPIAIMRRVMEKMHLPQLTVAYGMTETSPTSFQTSVDDPIDRRVSTVGKVHPHVEAKIVDQNGRVVPRGVSGELCIRGYSVMHGYWNDPKATDEAIDTAGWMHTGDLAIIDDEDYCTIVGRIKDMIIRGGENIYPREIEELLFTHPKVQSVACFGVPNRLFGEEVCAWIQLRAGAWATEDEIRLFCKETIAHYKVPRYVRFVEEFPMTVTGKLQKFVMRERMIAELNVG